jgi:hypothetical protein
MGPDSRPHPPFHGPVAFPAELWQKKRRMPFTGATTSDLNHPKGATG